MKNAATQIINAALKAVDPYQAVHTHLQRNGQALTCGQRVYNLDDFDHVRVVGFGKGSAPMAHAVHTLLADRLTDGLVIVKYNHTLPASININPITVVEAGHPVPDKNGLAHTHALTALLANSTARDLILCLVSGGGSALLTHPVAGVSLADVQALTRQLLAAGADITQINTIRKHLSRVKGGGLARLAAPATLISLILSDVGGDPLDVIASGPTTPDPTTFADALAILDTYRLTHRAAPAIVRYLRAGQAGNQPETPKANSAVFAHVQNQIIANNQMALRAAVEKAIQLGFETTLFADFLEGEARDVAAHVVRLLNRLSRQAKTMQKPAALIMGGETTVTLRGDGLGGRNQEMALAIALHIQQHPNVLVACVATDGNDGPTNAAGAFVNGQTVGRANELGLSPQRYLDANDSYHFFEALGELIITGPTNTNVNDIVVLLAW